MNDHLEIGTERLILGPLALDHAEQLYAIYSDPDTMRFWPTPRHRNLNDTLAMVMSSSMAQSARGRCSYEKMLKPWASYTISAIRVHPGWAIYSIHVTQVAG